MNRRGSQNKTISVLAPIVYGHQDALRSYLGELPTDERSPFGALGQAHFARFLLLDAFEAVPPQSHHVGPLMDQYLLFTSYFSGRPAGFREALRLRAGNVADDIWRHCIGYPGQWDRAGFHAYLKRNEVAPQLFFSAYSASVDEVRTALSLRAQHSHFAAIASQTSDSATLQREFLHTFGSEPLSP